MVLSLIKWLLNNCNRYNKRTYLNNFPLQIIWTLFSFDCSREFSAAVRARQNWSSADNLNPESGKFLPLESEILDFGIRNTTQGIRNPFHDWNPDSKSHWERIQNRVPGLWTPRRGIQNPNVSWIPLHWATGTFSSVAFKLLIEKSFCNLTGFVQAMEILESHGI